MYAVRRWWMVALVFALLCLVGCSQQPDAVKKAMEQARNSPPPTPAPAPAQNSGPSSVVVAQGSGGAAQSVRRSVQGAELENELRQVGIFIKQANALNGKPPQSQKELINEIKRDAPQTAKRFEEKYYIYVPTASLSPNDVVVYEKDAAPQGQRYVLMGDGSVQIMDAADLKKAVPNLK